MQVTIVNASKLDIDRHILLLRQAFEQSAWAAQISATLTREFYLWKYFSPAGEAVISSALVEGEFVSSVAAVPTLFQAPSGVKRGWQIGDIATLPSARRKGHYRRCLSALVESLGDQLLVCFPNDNSRGEIEGQDFRFAADVLTFVRPLNPFATRPRLAKPEGTPAAFEEFKFVDRSGNYSFFKDRDYLEWRYQKNPACQYNVVQAGEGYCVLRSFNLFGRTVSIVMEVTAGSERVLDDLIKQSERIAASKRMRANFIMTSSPLRASVRRRYLAIPQMLLPKRQALYFRMPGGERVATKWNVQIGDWDGL